MVQWTNLQQIKRFVYLTQLYITCEKSGGLHQVEPGFTAVRQSGRQNLGEVLKLAVDQNIQFSSLFSETTALFQQL